MSSSKSTLSPRSVIRSQKGEFCLNSLEHFNRPSIVQPLLCHKLWAPGIPGNWNRFIFILRPQTLLQLGSPASATARDLYLLSPASVIFEDTIPLRILTARSGSASQTILSLSIIINHCQSQNIAITLGIDNQKPATARDTVLNRQISYSYSLIPSNVGIGNDEIIIWSTRFESIETFALDGRKHKHPLFWPKHYIDIRQCRTRVSPTVKTYKFKFTW